MQRNPVFFYGEMVFSCRGAFQEYGCVHELRTGLWWASVSNALRVAVGCSYYGHIHWALGHNADGDTQR